MRSSSRLVAGVLSSAAGLRDAEGAVPGEGADVLRPVVVEVVAGLGNDFQVAGAGAGGAEAALNQGHRVIDGVGPEHVGSIPGQVAVVVTPGVG